MPEPDLFHRSPDGELWVSARRLDSSLTTWAEAQDEYRDKAGNNEVQALQYKWAARQLRRFRDQVRKHAEDVPEYGEDNDT